MEGLIPLSCPTPDHWWVPRAVITAANVQNTQEFTAPGSLAYFFSKQLAGYLPNDEKKGFPELINFNIIYNCIVMSSGYYS